MKFHRFGSDEEPSEETLAQVLKRLLKMREFPMRKYYKNYKEVLKNSTSLDLLN